MIVEKVSMQFTVHLLLAGPRSEVESDVLSFKEIGPPDVIIRMDEISEGKFAVTMTTTIDPGLESASPEEIITSINSNLRAKYNKDLN